MRVSLLYRGGTLIDEYVHRNVGYVETLHLTVDRMSIIVTKTNN